MRIIIWIINVLTSILAFAGFPGILYAVSELDTLDAWFWWLTLGCFVLGTIFGILAWHFEVPPRWYWTKSQSELMDNAVGYLFNCGCRFAMIPSAILLITRIVDYISQ